MEEAVLKIEHLKKQFNNQIILNDINLTVNKGEVIVVLGPSGCGKSTLLRCVNGLEPIQSGESKHFEHNIGMVFQNYELFPHMNVLNNIMLAPIKVHKRAKAEVKVEAMELLTRVGLADRANQYPRQLSGGQKQRVAIVRALAMHPEILLFDEVTAALDPEMVREVFDVMLDLARQGRTMLIVTHEMQFARAVADRIVFIDDGRIVEEGIPEEFFDNPKTERARKFLNVFSF